MNEQPPRNNEQHLPPNEMPRYSRPMIGWPLSAAVEMCGCHQMPVDLCPGDGDE